LKFDPKREPKVCELAQSYLKAGRLMICLTGHGLALFCQCSLKFEVKWCSVRCLGSRCFAGLSYKAGLHRPVAISDQRTLSRFHRLKKPSLRVLTSDGGKDSCDLSMCVLIVGCADDSLSRDNASNVLCNFGHMRMAMVRGGERKSWRRVMKVVKCLDLIQQSLSSLRIKNHN